jgi:hypothetical protein
MRLFRGKSIAVPAEALHSYPQAPWPPVHRSLTAWRDPSHRPTAAAKLRSESQSRSLLASGALTVDQLLDRWLIDRRITARSYSSWLANRLDVTCWKKVARPSMRGRRMAESSRPATPNTSAEPSLCPTPPCDFWNANATGRPNGNGGAWNGLTGQRRLCVHDAKRRLDPPIKPHARLRADAARGGCAAHAGA